MDNSAVLRTAPAVACLIALLERRDLTAKLSVWLNLNVAGWTGPGKANMEHILIIRKGDKRKGVAITKAHKKAIEEALKASRVQRPELVDFFMSGEFAASQAIPQNVIDNPLRREAEFPGVGWIVPEGSLGRAPKKGKRDYQSTAQSILLWIKKYFVETGAVRIDDISVVVVNVEE